MPQLDPQRQAHWQANRRITAALLLVWWTATWAVVYWPADWDWVWAGWPLGFWLAAQGVLLLYGLLVWVYDLRMAQLDRRCGLAQAIAAAQGGDDAA